MCNIKGNVMFFLDYHYKYATLSLGVN